MGFYPPGDTDSRFPEPIPSRHRVLKPAVTRAMVEERAKEVIELLLDRHKELYPHEKCFLENLEGFRMFSVKQMRWLRRIAYRFVFEIPEEAEASYFDRRNM